jgi:ABC-type nickel/cobalt efflux system permease component RcnA
MLTWAVPLLVAFSIGLASVLVIVGVLVVKARDAIGKSGLKADWMDRASRVLPIFSAAVVTLIGFWLCSESLK